MITTRSARLAILQATAHGRETRARAGVECRSSTPKVAYAFSCGAVLAALERNPLPVQDWLICAYAAEGYPGRRAAAIRCQGRLYLSYVCARSIRTTPERLFRVAQCVMVDLRQRVIGAAAPGYAWYAQEAGFRPQNLKSWAGVIEQMLDTLDRWDREGLARIASMLPAELALED